MSNDPSSTTRPSPTSAADRFRDLARLFEKLPPHAIEAEMCLLGSLLIDAQAVGDALLIVRSGDEFYKPANGVLYDAMVELYDQHATLDIVQLNQLLADRGQLESIGGVEYLVELAGSVPSAANAAHYARLVHEKALLRDLIDAAGQILYDAYHRPERAKQLLDEAEQRIFQIAHQNEQSKIESMHELINQTMAMLEENEGRRITGVATGFAELDEITGGIQRGELMIVAARPSMGKTALALNIAEQVGLARHPVGFFSLEMSRQQLVQRLLAARSGVDSQRLRRNMLNHDEHHRLMVACDQLMSAPIYIDDTPGLSLLQLRAKARRMVAKHEVELIFIDYLQLMTSGRRVESRQLEVSEISRGVKAMARELNIPVVALSQLNRAAEQREGHRPRMSDLRESGSIEQDADVVTMLHREEYYHQGDPSWAQDPANEDKVGVAEVILAKQRNGPTGTVRLAWISQSTRFRDYATARPPAGAGVTASSVTTVPFAPGAGRGPVENFRDGGGPEYDGDVDDLPV